jgi:hypothetical protein
MRIIIPQVRIMDCGKLFRQIVQQIIGDELNHISCCRSVKPTVWMKFTVSVPSCFVNTWTTVVVRDTFFQIHATSKWCKLRESNPLASKEAPGYSREDAIVHNLQNWRKLEEFNPYPFQEPPDSNRFAVRQRQLPNQNKSRLHP